MNIGWNIETFLSIFPFVFTGILSVLIIKIDWKKYGFLYLISAITGVILCYVFIYLNLYLYRKFKMKRGRIGVKRVDSPFEYHDGV